MENNINNISFLLELFHNKKGNLKSLFPIIKEPEKIKDLISFFKSNKNDIKQKFEIINKLLSLFKSNIVLIPLFIKSCKRNNLNLFYESIFDIYLKEEIDKDKELILEDLIKLLIENTSLPKSAPEYLYQKMSQYFNKKNEFELNEQLFMKYLKILHLCYIDNSSISEIEEKKEDKIKSEIISKFEQIGEFKKVDDIKDYMYFSGYHSSFTIELNNNSNSSINSFPNLENGLSFVFWLNLEKQILIDYNKLNKSDDPSFEINLINMHIAEHKIKLILKDSCYFQIIADKNKSNLIYINTIFNFGKWVNICFIISKKTLMNPATIKIFINGASTDSFLTLPKEFPSKIRLTKLTFFENLIGRASSLLLFSFPLQPKLIKYFAVNMNNGIYNNKNLFKFLIYNENNYFKNAINYKYCEKYKNENNKEKLVNILLKEQNIKNIISIFSPFAYNQKDKSIEDIFGNYFGYFSKYDGVNNYVSHIKNIQTIGGISNLLPIAELMLNYKNSKKNIITEKTVLKYLNILKNIIIGHKDNLYDANKNYFFSNLGLFLEKFPSYIYTEKLLHILLDIGKEVFQYNDINNKDKNDNYINNILLNEKIFSKFSTENQIKLWDEVNKFFISDYSIIKESLNINKICILLRFYDENRYNEHCCKKHANIIKLNKNVKGKNKNLKNIMNPEMNIKTEKLFETIQLYINKIEENEDTVNLYTLLLLDLSPCLQIKTIQVFINYFDCNNISSDKKVKFLINLLKNHYFEITLYVLTISLLDVRIQLLKLLKIFVQNYRNQIESFFGESKKEKLKNLFCYIEENFLPDKLFVEINNEKQYKDDKDYNQNKKTLQMNVTFVKRSLSPPGLIKNVQTFSGVFYQKNVVYKDRISLMKFINKDLYNEEKEQLWLLFSSWIIYETQIKSKNVKNILLINNFAINFCMNFTSKNELKYMANFLIILNAYLNDEAINNTEEIYSNNKLFIWLIEVIFNYHNKENNKYITYEGDLKYINNIQDKSLQTFEYFLKNKNKTKKNYEQFIKTIFNYSIYIKNKVDNEENINVYVKKLKKDEISRITSFLLLTCLESASIKINFVTNICFRFLIYYKNSKLILNSDNNNTKFNINNNNINDDNNSEDSFEVVDKPYNINNNEIIYNENEYNAINSVFGSINKDNLIPYYILEGINYDESKFEFENDDKNKMRKTQSLFISSNLKDTINLENNQKKKKLKKNVLLKEIWKDFNLYDYIIDYYFNNLWGLENLCKRAKIEYNNNPNELIKKLYHEYSNNKKNALLEPVLQCFNIQKKENKSESNNNLPFNSKNIINKVINPKGKKNDDPLYKDNINILTINLILLSVAIQITNDKYQKEYLENQYQQLIIFCILASINIKSNEKTNKMIQNELYSIIGYGILFLKTINEQKYQQIFNYLINPIFKEINEVHDNKGIMKKLGLKKRQIYSETAIFKLFSEQKKPVDDFGKTFIISNFEDNNNSNLSKANSFDQKSIKKNALFELYEDIEILNPQKEDEKENEEQNNKKLDDNYDFALYEIKPNFQINKDYRIDLIFNSILNIYKQFNYQISQNIKKLLNERNNDDLIYREKKRIFSEMKKLIPNYIEILKKYSNSSYLIEKKKRNIYKKTKYNLFSWRGFWSNKYLFFTHPEYLKLKIKNHYTKEMIKPILTPVLDINYYFPKFKSFNTANLFNKNNYYYNINLDVDDILKEEKKIVKKESFNSLKNVYGFNYLECLYKLQDHEIWEYYKLSLEEKKNANKNIEQFQNDTLININRKRKKKKNKDTLITHSFQCCIVKVTNHIKGYIKTGKNNFEFSYIEEDQNKDSNNVIQNIYINIEDDISYDKDMGCCFGSLFKNHKRDKEKINFSINYENINYLFIRNYYYRDTAIEIFTEQNKSYFFNFKTKDDLLLFISDIVDKDIKFRQIVANVHDDKDKRKLLGYEKLLPSMKNKTYYISNKVEEWQNYNISTLEYLMWLNIYSGRSFNDLNQYPVFPWILANYSSDKISENSEKDFRPLNVPIGMLEINDKSNRKDVFITFYEGLKNEFLSNYPDIDYPNLLNKGQEYLTSYKKKKLKLLKKDKNQIYDNNYEDALDIPYNQIPYNYGTHYSNPTYVSHYLARIFPFSFVSIEIHGNKFDDPERMFYSLEKTFESISSLKDDIRELIPEFYFLPEMFENINNLNLAQDHFDSNGNDVIINDVKLPPWSKNNSINFVLKMRKYLESNNININKWIDLIFGSYQRGENAESINNIYMSYTYEKMVKIMEITDYDQRCALLRLYETGVTPRNLFKNDSKQRIEKSIFAQKTKNSTLHFLEESVLLDCNYLKMKKYNLLMNNIENKDLNNKIFPKIIQIKIKNSDTLIIITNTNQYFSLSLKKDKKEDKKDKKEKKINEEKHIYFIENASSLYAANYLISSIETPTIIYNNNKLMLKAGFWDGRIEINTIQFDSKEENKSSIFFSNKKEPIVCMEMTRDEKLLFCGTKVGAILIYEVNGKNLEIKDTIYSHNDEITSIFINDDLNMFATSSLDGYIMIYILPSFQLVRAIHISSLKKKLNNNIENENNENLNNNENNNIININNHQIKKNIFDEGHLEEYNEKKCLYAEKVFLSSSPLPCIVIYISDTNTFRSYTINGEFINEIKEEDDSTKIFSPIIYKNLNFHEFLIYGTNKGYIKIRDFPKMNLMKSFKAYQDDCNIKTLALSNNKKYCYSWGQGENLAIISDNNIASDFQEL